MSLDLSPDQLDRYSRHIIMDDVGPAGQAALLDGRVLVVGAGGLGSPALQYLAAAGVGHLGVVDDDHVERSNLQRQVVHRDADVGRPKVESAKEFVNTQNPDVTVGTYETRLDETNVEAFLEEYDVVVDCSDNFATRYLVNDACTLAGVPFSHGAILRFEGQITTFEATAPTPEGENGPCYRCLFPEAPEPGTVPDCATAGVLGVLPGTVGCIQATETVKLLLDYGEPLDGRMVFYDAAEMSFREIPVEPRPDCPVCQPGGIDSVDEVTYRDRLSRERRLGGSDDSGWTAGSGGIPRPPAVGPPPGDWSVGCRRPHTSPADCASRLAPAGRSAAMLVPRAGDGERPCGHARQRAPVRPTGGGTQRSRGGRSVRHLAVAGGASTI